MRARCWFVNESSGALAFVREVTDYHAHLQIVTREGATSQYAMPIAEYDSGFIRAWRPAETADLQITEGQNFRLPKTAPPEWAGEEEPASRAGLDVETIAVALNTAQLRPDEFRLGRDLRKPAARILAALVSAAGQPTGQGDT